MTEEHPCPCESILSLLPFVLRTESEEKVGEVSLWLFLSIFHFQHEVCINHQQSAPCVLLLITSCSGIFNKLFSWGKKKFVPFVAVLLKPNRIKSQFSEVLRTCSFQSL